MYPAFLHWWEEVEVVWSMRAELLQYINYIESRLMADLEGPLLMLLRNEWAVEVFRDLLYHARAGNLFWIPELVREDMRLIRIGNAFRWCGMVVIDELETLLCYVDKMSWSQCPPKFRYPFSECTKSSLAFVSGEFSSSTMRGGASTCRIGTSFPVMPMTVSPRPWMATGRSTVG